jgi:hypothetical protein
LRVYCGDRPGATKVTLAGLIERKRLAGVGAVRSASAMASKKNFTITSGTLFASHKLPLKGYLAAIAIFCNEIKGKSALALFRDLCISYKACFTNSAMAIEG